MRMKVSRLKNVAFLTDPGNDVSLTRTFLRYKRAKVTGCSGAPRERCPSRLPRQPLRRLDDWSSVRAFQLGIHAASPGRRPGPLSVDPARLSDRGSSLDPQETLHQQNFPLASPGRVPGQKYPLPSLKRRAQTGISYS